MFYGLQEIERRFSLFFFSSAVAGIFSLSHSSLCLSLYYYNFFFEPLDLLCAGHRSWHCVSQGHRSWYCVSQASVSSESTILSFLSWRPTDSSIAVLLPSLDTGWKLQQHIHSTDLCLVTIGVSASSAQPSHSLRPVATSTGVHQRALLVAFILRPSIREPLRPSIWEFHQHALLTALTLRPSTHFGYSNSILSGCLWP